MEKKLNSYNCEEAIQLLIKEGALNWVLLEGEMRSEKLYSILT